MEWGKGFSMASDLANLTMMAATVVAIRLLFVH